MSKRMIALVVMMVIMIAASFGLVACGDDEETTTTEAITETTEGDATDTTQAEPMDIVDTATAAGQLHTFVALIEDAGLVDTLKGEGPFTVFAPTDEAFAAVPPETLEPLAADPTGALAQVLNYHVIPGQVMAADVTEGMEATTLQGEPVTFSLGSGAVMIEGATIVTTDIVCTNGVIHVIDAVILPPSLR